MLKEEVKMTVLVDPELRTEFTQAALKSNRSADEALRDFMRAFVIEAREPGQAHSPISAAEKRDRQHAVDAARATVRLEGFIPSAEREEAARRYASGEIDLDGFMRGIAHPDSDAMKSVTVKATTLDYAKAAALSSRDR